jgi:hypothetical protein
LLTVRSLSGRSGRRTSRVRAIEAWCKWETTESGGRRSETRVCCGYRYGRELITEALRVAREPGADYVFVITNEDDRLAQRLNEGARFRRTDGRRRCDQLLA